MGRVRTWTSKKDSLGLGLFCRSDSDSLLERFGGLGLESNKDGITHQKGFRSERRNERSSNVCYSIDTCKVFLNRTLVLLSRTHGPKTHKRATCLIIKVQDLLKEILVG